MKKILLLISLLACVGCNETQTKSWHIVHMCNNSQKICDGCISEQEVWNNKKYKTTNTNYYVEDHMHYLVCYYGD